MAADNGTPATPDTDPTTLAKMAAVEFTLHTPRPATTLCPQEGG